MQFSMAFCIAISYVFVFIVYYLVWCYFVLILCCCIWYFIFRSLSRTIVIVKLICLKLFRMMVVVFYGTVIVPHGVTDWQRDVFGNVMHLYLWTRIYAHFSSFIRNTSMCATMLWNIWILFAHTHSGSNDK